MARAQIEPSPPSSSLQDHRRFAILDFAGRWTTLCGSEIFSWRPKYEMARVHTLHTLPLAPPPLRVLLHPSIMSLKPLRRKANYVPPEPRSWKWKRQGRPAHLKIWG